MNLLTRGKRLLTPQMLKAMKLTLFFLTAAFLHVSAKGFSQSITFSGKNIPLEKVFQEIKKQSDYVVFYDYDLVRQAKPVSLDVKNANIREVMDATLKDQPLVYSIENKTIIIIKKITTTVDEAAITDLPPPPIDVHGRVVNEKGEPVEGVSVKIKGTDKGTSTDANGEFTLKGIDQNAVLQFTSTNMETFEIKVEGKTELAISLKTKITALGDVEVKINTGYQQINKERFVGSVTQLDSFNYNRRAGMDILNRLDGTVSGLFFDHTGNGDLASIRIRGISTLGGTGGSEPFAPLIIVDNFPFAGDISSINPNDVEDITILKDAAAASVWGVRAGNGVIVITTKKGSYNKIPRITVTSNVTIQQKPDLFYFPQMSSSDFIDVEQNLFNQGFYDGNLPYGQYLVTSPVVDILEQERNGTISAADATAQINAFRKLDVRNDINKYVYKAAISQQHYINLSGGNRTYSYDLSLGYNNSSLGIQEEKNNSQFTIKSANRFQPIKNLELELDFNSARSIARPPAFSYPIVPQGGATQIYPYAQLADANGNTLPVAQNYRAIFTDTAGSNNLLDWHYRPLDEIRLADNMTTTNLARINFGMSYKIMKFFKAEVQYQFITQIANSRNYYSQQTYYARNLINLYTQFDGNTYTKIIPLGGILDVGENSTVSQNGRGQLTFNRTWLGKHELTVMAASEISDVTGNSNGNRFYGYHENNSTYAQNLDYNTYYGWYAYIGGGQIPQQSALGSTTHARIVSVLGNASYRYLNRYNLYISARRDGANVFGVNTNNKWKPLWSSGASWDISKENFYHLSWLPLLRFRVSYGFMGNVNNSLSGLPTISYQQYPGAITNLTTAIIGSAPNPDLRWEQVKTTNVGFDFGALNNRLSGSVEWFQKVSTDLISPIPFDPTSGVTSFTVNSASLKGHGIEVSLHSINTTGAFRWTTSLQLAYSKTIVAKYYGGSQAAFASNFVGGGINPIPGQLAWGIYSYRFAGLDPATGDPQGYLNGAVSKDYYLLTNDSLKNAVFSGSFIPLYYGNMLNSVAWRNFTLSANVTYRFDFYFRKPTISYSTLANNWVGNSDYSKRWQKSGDEKTTTVPSFTYPVDGFRDNFYAYSQATVLKGDNIRLADVRLSYDWVNRGAKQSSAKSAQFFIYVNNLNLILWRANKAGLDPDFTGGSSGVALPLMKTWTLGVNVNL